MQFAWKGMLPIAILNLGLTAIGIAVFQAIVAAR
jgi:NADH:ubiquinone oxidoreductase subunit H